MVKYGGARLRGHWTLSVHSSGSPAESQPRQRRNLQNPKWLGNCAGIWFSGICILLTCINFAEYASHQRRVRCHDVNGTPFFKDFTGSFSTVAKCFAEGCLVAINTTP